MDPEFLDSVGSRIQAWFEESEHVMDIVLKASGELAEWKEVALTGHVPRRQRLSVLGQVAAWSSSSAPTRQEIETICQQYLCSIQSLRTKYSVAQSRFFEVAPILVAHLRIERPPELSTAVLQFMGSIRDDYEWFLEESPAVRSDILQLCTWHEEQSHALRTSLNTELETLHSEVRFGVNYVSSIIDQVQTIDEHLSAE